jgi:hypothetical protein
MQIGRFQLAVHPSYLRTTASVRTQAAYGVIFSLGLGPTTSMSLWVHLFAALWPVMG